MKCFCMYCRLWPPSCCETEEEKQIRATSKEMFKAVNTDANCCGCEDSVLEKTETMLLFSVLDKESRGEHRGLIEALIAELKTKTSSDSQDGNKINKLEFEDAMMKAASTYIVSAMRGISAEVTAAYGDLDNMATGGGAKVHPGAPICSEEMER